MDHRLLTACERELVAAVERRVEDILESRRAMLPDGQYEIPLIGDFYRPRATCGKLHTDLKMRIVRAVLAQKWFENEAPARLQPLPLREDKCRALLNDADLERRLVGRYGLMLRSIDWQPPFPVWDVGQWFTPSVYC